MKTRERLIELAKESEENPQDYFTIEQYQVAVAIDAVIRFLEEKYD